jgi:hypothetical protein
MAPISKGTVNALIHPNPGAVTSNGQTALKQSELAARS